MKCGKVKNPCKICFQTVTNKNGLQCKGACKKWAHFKCLNYTPGKISDVKAGLIQITCPCPDCVTSEPKEIITSPPLKCENEECPAAKRPICEVPDCPNKDKPIPIFPPQIPTGPRPKSPNEIPSYSTPPVPPTTCITPPKKSPCPSPPNKCPPSQPKKSPCPSPPKKSPCSSPPEKSPCPSPPKKSPCRSPRGQGSPPRRSASPPHKITVSKRPCTPSCPAHCPKRSGEKIGRDKPSPQRSQSCSLNSHGSSHSGKSHFGLPGASSSDSALLSAQEQKMLCGIVEQMCNTTGQLSCQMKELMRKMKSAFQKKSS